MNSQQQQQDIYSQYDIPSSFNHLIQSHSPITNRDYSQHTLNRQTSRHFENYSTPYTSAQMPSSFQSTPRNERMPSAFGNASRMDTARFEGMNTSSLQSNYSNQPYASSTWNMGNGMGNGMGDGMGSQSFMGMGSATTGASNRNKPQQGRRAPLPTQWMDQPQQPMAIDRNGLAHLNYGGNEVEAYSGEPHIGAEPTGDGEDLIPTAIVIKNIPFAVKKEALTEIMLQQNLPLPYAFNYHFDSGVFRGLAFANFTSADETRQVINSMNHMEISGRKLRVEYKKMLPARERERIEREKRERRGQLEEQHRPTQVQGRNGLLQTQSSMSSLSQQNTGTSPSPVSFRARDEINRDELNMNDPTVLQYFSELMLFIGDGTREVMIFPETIPPEHRRIIHTLAHKKGLEHRSRGHGEARQVVVTKTPTNLSPPLPPAPIGTVYGNSELNRRALNRAATTDFSSHRMGSNADYQTTERNPYLDIPNSPSNGFGGRNLREAKSFADLRSHSGSPSLNPANFPPPMPNTNLSRYEVGGQSATPNLTPTSSNNALSSGTDELTSTFGGLMLGFGNERPSTNRSNGRLNMDRDTPSAPTGAIGSHRPSNGTYEDQARNGGSLAPERQPRLPGWDQAQSFGTRGRQNGIGSRGDAPSNQSGRYL